MRCPNSASDHPAAFLALRTCCPKYRTGLLVLSVIACHQTLCRVMDASPAALGLDEERVHPAGHPLEAEAGRRSGCPAGHVTS